MTVLSLRCSSSTSAVLVSTRRLIPSPIVFLVFKHFLSFTFWLDNDVSQTSKRRLQTFNMLLRNVLSQFFIVKCFKKPRLFRELGKRHANRRLWKGKPFWNKLYVKSPPPPSPPPPPHTHTHPYIPFDFLIFQILLCPRPFDIQSQTNRVRCHPRKRPSLEREKNADESK